MGASLWTPVERRYYLRESYNDLEESMPPRLPPINDVPSAFTAVNRRLDKIEESLTDRLLPPDYVINVVAGSIVITRRSDGATSTLVFA